MSEDIEERERALAAFIGRVIEQSTEGGQFSLTEALEEMAKEELDVAREFFRELYVDPSPTPGAVDGETRFGSYSVVSEIGRGGQGVVYKAIDTRFGRTVALKVLQHRGNLARGTIARFRREAAVASRLHHPGICGMIEVGVDQGVPFIAMPFIQGHVLSRHLHDLRLGIPDGEEAILRALDGADGLKAGLKPVKGVPERSQRRFLAVTFIFERLARALHAAHEAGVVHRDLKPGNVMITNAGEPVILDFGLASAEDADLETLTRTGDQLGTPAYMSPEQVSRGKLAVDRRTDIWSLGVSLYEALTLEQPFSAPTRDQLQQQIVGGTPRPPRRVNSMVPADLDVVVRKTIEKDPNYRYATAKDLADDLRRVRFREPVSARRPNFLQRSFRALKRRPAAAASVLITGLILAFGTGLVLDEHDAAQRLDRQVRALKRSGAADQETLRETIESAERLRARRAIERARSRLPALWPLGQTILSERESTEAELIALAADLPTYQAALDSLAGDAIGQQLTGGESRLPRPHGIADTLEGELSDLVSKRRGMNWKSSRYGQLKKRLEDRTKEREARAEKEAGEAEAATIPEFRDPASQARYEDLAIIVEGLQSYFPSEGEGATSPVVNLRQHRILVSRRIDTLSQGGQGETVLFDGVDIEKLWSDTIGRVGESEPYRIDEALRRPEAQLEGHHSWFDNDGWLRLAPQRGLVPLGPNPETGWEEFLHLLTHQLDWGSNEFALPPRRGASREGAPADFAPSSELGLIFVLVPTIRQADGHSGRFGASTKPFVPLFVSKFEMTQAQWARAAQLCDVPAVRPSMFGEGCGAEAPAFFPAPVTETHPVECVTPRLSALLLQRLGLELPTEQDWSRFAVIDEPARREAARGIFNLAGAGSDELFMELFEGSPEFLVTPPALPSEEGCTQVDGFLVHSPVGSFAPNKFGLYDLLGNVAEACWAKPEPAGVRSLRPLASPEAEGLDAIVFRGGSFLTKGTQAAQQARGERALLLRPYCFRGLRPVMSVAPGP